MTIIIKIGDCREVLKTISDKSVHCCVTSPPYFGLRDYGTAKWDGGDAECDHKQSTARNDGGRVSVGNFNGSARADSDKGAMNYRDICAKCGAIRIDSQIGLEPTPDAFVAELVAVFAEVRRVLRDDGTLWLNLGDSYGGPKGNTAMTGGKTDPTRGEAMYGGITVAWGKPKDLIGIPWRVAFALQADGWYLRQDIIWSKPNPMPESVTDRCTKAHEYIFLMSKSARYYYDQASILETLSQASVERLGQNVMAQRGSDRVPGKTNGTMKAVGRATGDVYTAQAFGNPQSEPRGPASNFGIFEKRNKRSVWEVTTQPFSEAHFATFPPDLIEPCIKAGCPKGGIVLDPFGGSGTTGMVADRLGRNAILIELNPEYAKMTKNRISDDAGMFAEIS